MRSHRAKKVGSGRLRRAAVVLMMPFAMGCYTYAESSLEMLSPGIQTRVRLDADGFGRVVNQAAMSGVPVETFDLSARGIVGRLVSLEPSDMRVELRGVGGSVFSADIPMQAVEGVAVRTFSLRRTLLAAGGGALLAGLVYSGTVGGTTTPPEPTPPELMSFPLFSVFVR